MNKKVSIVLPVYNAEDYLSRCLDSILNQQYDNIEIIAIDDGSKDHSWEILNRYKNKYTDKMVIVKQDNIGVSKTRNKAINMATGDYLLFIDNDDFYDNDYINRFVLEIEAGDYDVVIGGYKRPNDSGKIIESVTLEDLEFSKYKIVAAWAKIYRLSYIKNNEIYFLDSNIGEDIHFTIQAVTLTDKIKIISYTGYNWYYNEESVSNTSHKSLDNNLEFDYLLDSIYNKLHNKDIEFDELIEYYLIKLNIWYILYTAKGSNYKVIKNTLQRNFTWLKDRFPNYKHNKYIGLFKLKGDIFSQRFIVWIFISMMKCKVIGLFLRLYSYL